MGVIPFGSGLLVFQQKKGKGGGVRLGWMDLFQIINWYIRYTHMRAGAGKMGKGDDGPTQFSCITEISTIPRGNIGRIRFWQVLAPFWWKRIAKVNFNSG